jgi:hypothetical protein
MLKMCDEHTVTLIIKVVYYIPCISFAFPYAGNVFFRHRVMEKVSLQGPEGLFSMGEKGNVSLQGPEGFTGIEEWKRSHSRDKKTFPAWGNEKDFPPQTGRLFRHAWAR